MNLELEQQLKKIAARQNMLNENIIAANLGYETTYLGSVPSQGLDTAERRGKENGSFLQASLLAGLSTYELVSINFLLKRTILLRAFISARHHQAWTFDNAHSYKIKPPSQPRVGGRGVESCS